MIREDYPCRTELFCDANRRWASIFERPNPNYIGDTMFVVECMTYTLFPSGDRKFFDLKKSRAFSSGLEAEVMAQHFVSGSGG